MKVEGLDDPSPVSGYGGAVVPHSVTAAATASKVLTESAHNGPAEDASLTNPARLQALKDTGLLDSPSPVALQLLCELACTKLDTPVALVSLVADQEQVFAGSRGLCEPWGSRRRTPLSHSFCQHVVSRREPLIIRDATQHPLVMANQAIPDLNVTAYLGVPLVTSEDNVLGSICTIDPKPRQWTNAELEILRGLAATAMQEISEHQRQTKAKRRMEADLQQARKMEAIGTLASSIAHDFNNILMAYQSLTEMISFDPGDTERVAECAKTILTTNERAKAIVQQLVSWTHHGSQERMVLNLSQTIRSAKPLMRALLPANVELQIQVGQPDLFVDASPECITQILLNLIGNAEFAMRDRGGKLVVKLEERVSKNELEDSTPSLILMVQDDGCGIPAKLQHLVCSPFFTTKTGDGHSGMGLASVYETVRSLGGKLMITSVEEQGTSIEIQLPMLDAIQTHGTTSGSRDCITSSEVRILLVDDDVVIAKSMTETLRMYGYEVDLRTDSNEALSSFVETPNAYDLLLTDLRMPGMCGDELIRAVQKIRPDTPAVLLSGFNYTAEDETTGVYFLRKPIAISDLVDKIETALKGKMQGVG